MKKLIVAVLVVLLASSCVSNKKFNSMKAEALRLEGELAASRNRLDDMTGQNEKLAAEKARLVADTVRLSGELNDYRRRYKQLLDDGSAESARMLRELEDKEMALSDRSRRVAELEGMLRSREEAIDAIRRKVTDALTGFEGKGLSMYEDYYGGDVLPAAKLNPDILVSSTTAGKCSGNLLVHYEDSEGEAYTETVPVSFTVAEQPVVQQPEQNDQIESEPIEQPKKKLSTGAILGGGAAILALGGTGLGIALKKRRGKYEIS